MHKSASSEVIKGFRNSNERLEYLGDAVISSVVADFLFHKYPFKDEGFLTEMRSKIVSRPHLNKLSQKMGLDKLIKVEQDTGNVYRSISGDTFEALIGAIYLDKGYSFVRKVIINRIIGCHVDMELLENKELNYKSTLIEFAQKEKKSVEFKVISEKGSGYKKQYEVAVYYDNIAVSTGFGYTIKEAEQISAENAYNKVNVQNGSGATS